MNRRIVGTCLATLIAASLTPRLSSAQAASAPRIQPDITEAYGSAVDAVRVSAYNARKEAAKAADEARTRRIAAAATAQESQLEQRYMAVLASMKIQDRDVLRIQAEPVHDQLHGTGYGGTGLFPTTYGVTRLYHFETVNQTCEVQLTDTEVRSRGSDPKKSVEDSGKCNPKPGSWALGQPGTGRSPDLYRFFGL